MQCIIDTHCWLWSQAQPASLTSKQREIIEDTENTIIFSVVSAWEIAIKYTVNKLKLPATPEKYIPQRLQTSYMEIMPIQLGHVLYVSNLPPYHNDPFDRLLIAQAQIERLPILTQDKKFTAYDVEII